MLPGFPGLRYTCGKKSTCFGGKGRSMKRKTRNGQPLEDQPTQPFTAPLALRKRPTLWQRYRAAPRKVHIATGGILLLVFCLIFLSIGTVVVEVKIGRASVGKECRSRWSP